MPPALSSDIIKDIHLSGALFIWRLYPEVIQAEGGTMVALFMGEKKLTVIL